MVVCRNEAAIIDGKVMVGFPIANVNAGRARSCHFEHPISTLAVENASMDYKVYSDVSSCNGSSSGSGNKM